MTRIPPRQVIRSIPERTVVPVHRFTGLEQEKVSEVVAIEEPLEIQLEFGERESRQLKSISITMRTPDADAELALGFLYTEGVIRDGMDVNRVVACGEHHNDECGIARVSSKTANVVKVELAPEVTVNAAALQRNFYTTSSCGVCGKASLQALRSVCPPRTINRLNVPAEVLYEIPSRLNNAQELFQETGGNHASALFGSDGSLRRIREDVGRHNAVDKLIGAAILEDSLPLRDSLLLLSGRTSFELMQKAIMAGIPIVASIGAPSSLAVEIAKEFDVTLVGFLRQNHFNIYHGREHIHTLKQASKNLSQSK